MGDISFTKTFHHTPYVDNRDRVQAGGPNGFNARFDALESDLTSLADVVTQVDTALDTLGAGPAPSQQALTLAPALVTVSGASGWAHDVQGYAARTGPLVTLSGVQPVSLPHGSRLVQLRVVGQNSGSGLLRVALMRNRLISSVTPAERIARVTGDASPFDKNDPADPNFVQVDTQNYRYYLLANLDGAQNTDTVILSGFQITYVA